METDHLGSAFHFPELGQVPHAAKTRAQDLLASWLDMEDACSAASFGADQFPDLHSILDDDFFQFAAADIIGSHPPPLPSHHSTHDDAFLLHDSSTATAAGASAQPPPHQASPTTAPDDAYHPTLPDTCFSDAANSSNAVSSMPLITDSDMFLADDFYLIAPNDSFEGDTALLGSSSVVAAASSSTTNSMTTSHKLEANAGGVTVSPAPVAPPCVQEEVDQGEKEEEEEEDDKEAKPGTANCKNLVSERNRRKRLSQQLLALRALVPNITKVIKLVQLFQIKVNLINHAAA